MSPKKKVMYVVDTKDQKRHSRNCTVKESPGLYEEPDVLSSSDDEDEVENTVQSSGRAKQAQKDDETSRIINAVHIRQPLWDTRMNKLERNYKIQTQLWADVDEELGLETGKAKSLWGLIRHRFHSERRKVEAGDKTVWQYYTPLLFLVATRQKKQQSPAVTPKNSTSKSPSPKKTTPREVVQKVITSPKVSSAKVASPKVTVPKMFEPRKKKETTPRASNVASNSTSNNSPVMKETHQFFPSPNKRGRTSRSNIQPLYALPPPPPISMNDSRKREVSVSSSDSDVDVVEEIDMNGSLMRTHFENPISYKRVCIRQLQETQVQNLDDDDEDDEIRRFCSYLEVMLRKLPKENQEMFCEETLDHLASVNRKLRRSNF